MTMTWVPPTSSQTKTVDETESVVPNRKFIVALLEKTRKIGAC